ncbi:polysaccharide deacetylase family protein [Bacillus timonensis]|nr:polysaccharide deacetylase family protein [Bacillus timonensis]
MKNALSFSILSMLLLNGCNGDRDLSEIEDLGVEPQKVISLPNSDKNEMQVLQEPHSSFMIQESTPTNDQELREYLYNKYQVPKEWGEFIPGVKTQVSTDEKVIALTLDACGGTTGSGYDAELIYFLRQENVPATLFVNSRWIDANYWTFWALNRIPLFEIANHGTEHRPLSINGRSAWGIKGTENVAQMTDEVLLNHRKIEQITGKAPKYFRSGTAFYDDVGVKVVYEIGETPVNYNVLGDAGATFSKEQVRDALLNAKPGSIVLLHMNKPNSETAEGIKLAVPELKNRGYRFVKLSDYPLK